MDDIRRELNEYLFYEFAMDVEADDSNISATWPFELREVGRASDLIVFEFQDDQPYFALAAPSLNFLPKAGMTFDDLLLQNAGAKWIGARDPIDLSMSRPGDDTVPSGLDRRGFFDELGARALPGQEFEILVGVFLRTERRYLGLFAADGATDAVAVGMPSSPNLAVAFPDASAWRRLAWAVGRWLQVSSATATAG